MLEPASEFTPAVQLLLTVQEACVALRTTRGTLYRILAEGQLPSVKIGRRRYIRPAALAAFVDSLETGDNW